ncbi:unnamed protein product [Rotaria sp. Silwood2]|nr:unnamed protein product [Rotaria sp. Silwood2]CAF2471533.1 unnamed protein product [Rotaria sp. Silwood2]CAF2857707.1 unnamed protein product [Rotaria sp. Silwood2]CAF4312530.1 unnamed protein product [Rotaria sp. Silwood2]CAF4442698.1 unnamed protein product [Rotaria sp. Silwood2]
MNSGVGSLLSLVSSVKSEQQHNKSDVKVTQRSETQESHAQCLKYEALIFMKSRLMIVSDFSSLHIPADISQSNLTKLFSKYRKQLTITEMIPPPIIL